MKRFMFLIVTFTLVITLGNDSDKITTKDKVYAAEGTHKLTKSDVDYEEYKNGIQLTKYKSNYKDIKIPEQIDGKDVVSIGDHSFKGVVEKVTFPDTLKEIKHSAFNSGKIKELTIPSGIEKIGQAAFSANEIEKLTIEEGKLEEIEILAFAENNLKEVTIPKSVKRMGTGAFMSYDLEKITFLNNDPEDYSPDFTNNFQNPTYMNIDIYADESFRESENGEYFLDNLGNNFTYYNFHPLEDEGPKCFKTSSVSGGVSIKDYNAEACGTEVEIPEKIEEKKVTEIGAKSFEEKGITKVTIPNSVTKINSDAFRHNDIKHISFPKILESISNYAFADNKLKELKIPEGTKTIKVGAFERNELENVTLPDSLTNISGFSFARNNLKEVEIPKGIKTIYGYTFQNNKLENVTIPKNVSSIKDFAFRANKIKKVDLHENIEEIGKYAFQENKIEEVIIPDSVTELGKGAFYTNNIKRVDIGDGLKKIETHTFSDNNIKEVNLGDNIEELEAVSFSNADIKETLLVLSFTQDKDYYDLYDYFNNINPKGIKKINLPKKLKKIGDGAFFNHSIKTLDVPDSVEEIGEFAFYGNEMKNLEIGSKLKEIGAGAFTKNKLSEIELGNNVTEIDELAFKYNNLEKIDVKSTNTKIEKNAFKDQTIVKNEIIGVNEKKDIPMKYNKNGKSNNFDFEFLKGKGEVKDSSTYKWTSYPNIEKEGERNTGNINFESDGNFKVTGTLENKLQFLPGKTDPDQPGDSGQEDVESEIGDPDDEEIDSDFIDDDYEYEPEEYNGDAPTAKEINGSDFKEESEYVVVEVINPENKNPKNDIDRDNDKLEQEYKSANKVYDVGIKEANQTPEISTSNGKVVTEYKVCNQGNQDVSKFKVSVDYGDSIRDGLAGQKEFTDGIVRGDYNNIDSKTNCTTVSVESITKDIQTNEEDVDAKAKIEQTMPTGEEDNTPEDNELDYKSKVENPNASVYLQNEEVKGEDKENVSETGNAKLVVNNNMFSDISSTCENCADPNNFDDPEDLVKEASFSLYDKTNEQYITGYENKKIEYNNLPHGDKQIIDISKPIKDHVKEISEEENKYEIIDIEVEAEIPFYKDEVDYSGNPKYEDNKMKETIQHFPERPDVSLMKCNELDIANGNNLIKSCVGHYPNNPSTSIEEGMQAYHFVMYRFLPAPLPNYDVESAIEDADKNNPERFNQTYELNDPKNEKGDENSFIFSNKDDGIYTERSRYLPTSAEFDFSVKEKLDEESEKTPKVMAEGKITYDVPDACYQTDNIDLKNHYGCDEIMFFVPSSGDISSDVDNSKEKPDDYTDEDFEKQGEVNYPIEDTKIPYINPGLYDFELKAEEQFKKYKQVNTGVNQEYYWSETKPYDENNS